MLQASEILVLFLGLALFFIAPKIVGLVMRIIGGALILLGIVMYKFPALVHVPESSLMFKVVTILPVVAGLVLTFVGAGAAKLAVRVAGALLVISALVNMGVIGRLF